MTAVWALEALRASGQSPEVVRRPVESLGGLALIDLLSSGDTKALLPACQEMFRFEYADC